MPEQGFSFQRYLAAKKTVDDRALNPQVWQTLAAGLAALDTQAGRPVRILEVGAGIGTMVERLVTWGLPPRVEYTLVDSDPENTAAARQRIPGWAAAQGFAVTALDGAFQLERSGQVLVVRSLTQDALSLPSEPGAGEWDVLVAHAFLDLLDLHSALPLLLGLLRPGGWFYLTINFDGETIFEPPADPALEERIMQRYHQTMDERLTAGRPSGDSRTGRRLFAALPQAGGQIAAAGASDWVVFAQGGRYPADEAYFLGCIVQMVAGAVSQQPGEWPGLVAQWLAARQAQVVRGELVYIAHQLDFCGQKVG